MEEVYFLLRFIQKISLIISLSSTATLNDDGKDGLGDLC